MIRDTLAKVSFGEWLKRRRNGLGLTQKQLALRINCSTSALRKFEAEERRPSAQVVERLAEFFLIPAHEQSNFLKYARGDWTKAPNESFEESPWRASIVFPHTNLPAATTSFIGRKNEQNEIIDLLAKCRLLTLSGAGGIGKTRLSLEVGLRLLSDYPNGLWLVELASLSDPALVPQAMLTTLGLVERSRWSYLERLTNFLRTKRVLLIMDNCEHLIQACAELTETLLRTCPDLHILATGREALGIEGEMVYPVPPLSAPGPTDMTFEALLTYDAVRLFIERAQTVMPGFSMRHDNARTIAQICHHLDGIPLALELAAARLKLLNLGEIAARLDDRFHLLTSGTRTALPRYQTLRALIDWSHDLLPEPERVLLRRLSVFAGGWTLEAAEAVCGWEDDLHPSEVLDLLAHLVNKSLVIAEREEGRKTRYRMLETIRQYAYDKLSEAGETAQLRDRHQGHFLKLAEEIEPFLTGAEQPDQLDYLNMELDNMRVALECSVSNRKSEESLRLFGALAQFWFIRCHDVEGIEWFRRVLEVKEKSSKGVQAKALKAGAYLYWGRGDFSASGVAARESLDLYRELGDMNEIAAGLHWLGLLEQSLGNSARARPYLEDSLAISRRINDKRTMTRALMTLAYQSQREGDYDTASQQYEESLTISRQLQDSDFTALVLDNMGDLMVLQKNVVRARECYGEALTLSHKLKNKRMIAFAILGFANVLCAEAQHIQSARLQGFAIALLNELGGLPVPDMEDINKMADTLKSIMGKDYYLKEFEIGSAFQLEQAIAHALENQIGT